MNKSEVENFARVFKALADTTRQQILELLHKNGELSVTEITSHFTLAQPTISQHLRVLRDVEAVKIRKSGQQVYYRICNVKMYDAMEQFMETYEEETKRSHG